MAKIARISKVAAGAVAALLLASPMPVAAQQLFGVRPRVDVTVPGVMSQAQLARQLRSQGYNDIKLSSLYPTPADPNPQTHGTGGNPQTTPIHTGWNGTAVKDGRRLHVYVAYGAGPSVAEVPAE